jgi:valyl-tRNA synthetase
MPSQLSRCRAKKQAGVVGTRKMATAWICLSASLTTGARAAFVRNSASRSAAFGTRSFLPNSAAISSKTLLKSPSALAASTAADSKVQEYDVINKEKGLESYNPSAFESEIYSWWENSGCFQPDAKQNPTEDQKKPYVLPMPPPNVTGRLHMGHGIFVALQDILARFHRMRGRPVLWLPGM